MRKILNERNFAGALFLVVMLVFSFAHEDSKKRNDQYNSSTPVIPVFKTPASLVKNNVSVTDMPLIGK
jgi:hypothetical protein